MRVKLKDILVQSKDSEYIDHPETEKFVTVSGHGQGVKERKIGDGKVPVQFNGYRVKAGQLIYSRIGAGDGAFGIVPHSLNNAVVSKDFPVFNIDATKADINYLVYYLTSEFFCHIASKESFGATMTRFKEDKLLNCEIELPAVAEQAKVVGTLNDVKNIISLRQQELQKLDELIKARFVELFGDPVSNPYGYDKVALSELADIKIGPFGSLLHKEDYIEDGHPLLNPSHIIDGKISPDDRLTISDEKYEELSAYQLKTGDVVMGRRGEMGRCAVVLSEGFLCGTGSILIRTKGEVTADYIQKIISFPSFKKTIEDMAVGQTMPNLNVPIVSGFQIIKPPMEVQDSYYAFVEQVDKSKVVVKKALEESQMLFDSLMQEYFG